MTSDAEKRRLVYLCLEAPREGQASFAHVHEIAQGLTACGWHVDIMAPNYSGNWVRPNLLVRLLEYVRVQYRVVRLLKNYDALYVRAHPLAWPTSMLARLLGLPVVQEVNGTYADLYVAYPGAKIFHAALDMLQRSQYRAADAIIAVTQKLREWVVSETIPRPIRVEVVSNGANIDTFSPTATSAAELPAKYVVFFGGLTRWHGTDDMSSCVFSKHWPDGVSLVVAGDGEGAATLRTIAEYQPRLLVLGRVPYKEIAGIVCGSLGGVIPISDPNGRSSAAGLAPLKLFETLACGVPAIVTDFPGQADLVREHGCGLVYASGDADGLAKAVAALESDPDAARRMGERGRKLVEERYTWRMLAEQTHRLLAELVAEAR